ncbi:hypothetical protein DLL80_23810 [Salmonella enterica subsp. enterica serovar Newport]|uniref:Uncharacterized protein n=1 Tax=Salmonella newport TaxID=108619 RepID=A0A5V6RME1_SALNE|nr:hypothetical protein [Salmonella enterica subsp. enterica serovar Newport]
MGFFGVSQIDFDAVKKERDIAKFKLSCEEMKFNIAMMLGNMKMSTAKAAGFVDSVKIFYDAEMLETAKILYAEIRPQVVELITESQQINNQIVETVEGLGDCKQAFLNYCSEAKLSLTEAVNDINALNSATVKLINSMDSVFC